MKKRLSPIAFILLLAVVIRFIWVFLVAPKLTGALGTKICPWDETTFVSPDFLQCYHRYAENILSGFGFAEEPGKPTAYVAPLYSFFLAAVYFVFGKSMVLVRLFQVFFDVASCYFIYKTAAFIFRQRVGLLAAALYAIYPLLFYQTGLVITETLFTFLLIVSLYFSTCFFGNIENKRAAFLAGLFLGLATLTRPNPLLYPFLYIPLLWLFYKGQWKRSLGQGTALFVVGFALTVGSWVVRNYIHFQQFVPVSSIIYHTYDEVDGSVQNGMMDYFAKKVSRIAEDKDAVVTYTLTAPFTVWYKTKQERFDIPIAFLQYTLLLGGIAGMIRAVKKRVAGSYPLFLMLVYYVPMLLLVTKNALARYTVPVMPFFIVFFAYLLEFLLQQIRTRRAE